MLKKDKMYCCLLNKELNLVAIYPTMERVREAKDKYVAQITEECFKASEEESRICKDRDYDYIYRQNEAEVTIHPVLLYL